MIRIGKRTAVAMAYRTLRIGYAELVTACEGGRSQDVVGSVTDVARALLMQGLSRSLKLHPAASD
jgi:hypothetical protein